MVLTCDSCGTSFEPGVTAIPGDVVGCVHCAAPVMIPRGLRAPEQGSPSSSIALSPTEARPETLAEEQILPPGSVIGSYRIERFVGRGGMGTVYRAAHQMLGRDVALKILPPKLARDPEFVRRFHREAQALATLNHPNIVAVHDMGQQGDIFFIAMEYVEGANVRDVLAARRLTPEEALRIVPALCEALEYAHSRGVIHRDIKPENIVLSRVGEPKIADFGLAKIVRGEAVDVPLTRTNIVMGTVEYMAPEQRDNLKGVDHRADIYSMGVMLYEMLTGELPIGRFEPPSRKVTIDVRIDDVVLRALEREPDRRYQRASHMGTDVSQVRAGDVASGTNPEGITPVSGGDGELRSGVIPSRHAVTLRDIRSRLTPRQVEKIGVYIIVCLAFWAFSVVTGPVPALCVTVFWGMAIALDIWRSYVRGFQAPEAPAPVAPLTAVPVPIQEKLPPVPAKWSGWASACVIAVIPCVFSLFGFLMSAAMARGPGGRPSIHVPWLPLMGSAAFWGTISLVLGMGTMAHVREFRGRLRGRPAAILAVVSGMASLLVVAWLS